jgi:hypothetical protein
MTVYLKNSPGKLCVLLLKRERERAGPYYPLGTIGTVPRAYEGMEGRKK